MPVRLTSAVPHTHHLPPSHNPCNLSFFLSLSLSPSSTESWYDHAPPASIDSTHDEQRHGRMSYSTSTTMTPRRTRCSKDGYRPIGQPTIAQRAVSARRRPQCSKVNDKRASPLNIQCLARDTKRWKNMRRPSDEQCSMMAHFGTSVAAGPTSWTTIVVIRRASIQRITVYNSVYVICSLSTIKTTTIHVE